MKPRGAALLEEMHPWGELWNYIASTWKLLQNVASHVFLGHIINRLANRPTWSLSALHRNLFLAAMVRTRKGERLCGPWPLSWVVMWGSASGLPTNLMSSFSLPPLHISLKQQCPSWVMAAHMQTVRTRTQDFRQELLLPMNHTKLMLISNISSFHTFWSQRVLPKSLSFPLVDSILRDLSSLASLF